MKLQSKSCIIFLVCTSGTILCILTKLQWLHLVERKWLFKQKTELKTESKESTNETLKQNIVFSWPNHIKLFLHSEIKNLHSGFIDDL